MLRDRDAQAHDQHVAVGGSHLHDLTDEAVRDRVARRAEPHRGEAVDLALLTTRDRRALSRKRAEQRTLDLQPLDRPHAGLIVDPAVDLRAPRSTLDLPRFSGHLI